jgi:hypothetical protein
MRAIGRSNGFRRAIHEVAAAAAMRMNVYESWAYVAVPGVDLHGVERKVDSPFRANCNNSFVFNNHDTSRQHFTWKYYLTAEENDRHKRTSWTM